ncbi:MAG: putative zinc-binding metallopeptidase, partial [Kiritimatiellia bacterium]
MPNLSKLTDEELLAMRFKDLSVRIEGTWLEERVFALYRELSASGINFKPRCYLADEWLCPDCEPVIGIAFFLAHPRLKRLERKMMLEVEGGDKTSCMQLLRHETGHALNYAYFLHRRKKWKQLFGEFHSEYPERYRYRPYSKRFVRHLDEWYAQYHPDEDFAETFAVWLDPESDWRRKYTGWKAMDKLLYVEALMKDIGGKAPRKPTGRKYWDIYGMKGTLRTYYKRKTAFYAEYYPDFHDFHL